jgi:hypothetical protein
MTDQNLSNLLRTYCDGELAPDEASALERRIEAQPELRASLRFERQLRERIAVVMQGEIPAAPGGLADRVHDAISGASDATDKVALGANDRAVAGRIAGGQTASRGGRSLRSRLVAPKRANVFAVAATLFLIASVVLIGIYGPRIDSLQRGATDDLVGKTARFVSRVHGSCESDPEMMRRKLPWRTKTIATDRLTAHLDGHRVEAFDLSDYGFEFNGGGECHVPGPMPSGHLIYTRPATVDAPEMLLSIFVVANEGQFDHLVPDFRLHQWHRFDGGPSCSRSVVGITDGDVVYFMVCGICDAESRDIKLSLADQLLAATSR